MFISSLHTISCFKILGSQESIASNGARFGVETKKLWPFEDDCAKLNGNVAAVPHFATVGHVFEALSGAQIMHTIFRFELGTSSSLPFQYQASEPHFFAPLCLSSLEQSESYPCAGPLDAPAHLLDSAPQRRYHTRRAAATPVAPTQIPPRSPPTKKATLQSQESPLEHLEIHSLSLLPLGAYPRQLAH
ncbi:hypothetical protein CK203_087236 [Vitis vinifera]|uniref:Uncharacterized protein n=1 Tax=Vitis vinifera TaxID=29760 RepID=A0A438BS26_VITVI|nr:hypothetical protein CK203_087236 [Vitis vinifera]